MRSFLFASTVVTLAFAGCTKQSPPGGPGATGPKTTTTERSYPSADDSDQTFTLKVPSTATDIDRGKSQEVSVSIDRGSKFNQAVTLKFVKAPAGITVSPSEVQLKQNEKEAKVTIDVAPDAAPGEKTIDVTATPETGKAVTMTMRVKVEEDKRALRQDLATCPTSLS